MPAIASAQRVDENAVAAAQDAFGLNVSGESLGLYDSSKARGFSPSAAGNIRLDGLYFDQAGNFALRLISGYRVLVGPSAVDQPFAAPSGIVEYHLRKPGERNIVSISALGTSTGTAAIEMDAQLRLAPNLGIAAGAAAYRYKYWAGGGRYTLTSALIGSWRPTPDVEIVPFWGAIRAWRNVSQPTLLFDGRTPPAEKVSSRFLGQKWAASNNTDQNFGVMANASWDAWQLRGGVFRSQSSTPLFYSQRILTTPLSDTVRRTVVAERDNFDGATSGQAEIARVVKEGPRTHLLRFSVWARSEMQRYGATGSAELSPTALGAATPVDKPAFTFGPPTRDRVRQITAGLAYEASWRDIGTINLGIQKTSYQKTVVQPGGALPTSRDHPWLFNASVAIRLSKSLTLFAGTNRGLEESDVAPDIAVNRNEAPPAIRTRQTDAGIRWALTPKMSFVGSVFSIQRPYYGLDQALVFRALGTLRDRGIELSLTGNPVPGLTLVTGGLFLDAEASGPMVSAKLIGKRPTGWTPVELFANADYHIPGHPALSVDIGVSHSGRQVASIDNDIRLPAQTLIDLGMRYRFKLGEKAAVLRVQATNLTDHFYWSVAGNKAVQRADGRQVSARLSIDL